MARHYYNDDFDYKPENTNGKAKRNINLEMKEPKKKDPSNRKIYVRYAEGAERYSMCKNTFMRLAAEAGAVRKINRLSLVNTEVFEEYLETFQAEY